MNPIGPRMLRHLAGRALPRCLPPPALKETPRTDSFITVASALTGEFPSRPYRLGPAKSSRFSDYYFLWASRRSNVYKLTIDGRSINIHVPRYNDGEVAWGELNQIDVETLARAISKVPPQLLRYLKNISLNPVPNPADALLAQIYNDKGFKSLASTDSKGTVWIYPTRRLPSETELVESLIHEIGHALTEKWGFGFRWKRAVSADGPNAPSQYARDNLREDMAETVSLYFTAQSLGVLDSYRQLFPNRFKLLEGLLKG